MPTTIAAELPSPDEVVALYRSVGWTAYTDDPARLVAALHGSTRVFTARDDAGHLIGLARTVSDGCTIVYVQDVLVSPEHQQTGIGRDLMDALVAESTSIRQIVLLTDAEPGQRAFYESIGLTESHDIRPTPLRCFVRLA